MASLLRLPTLDRPSLGLTKRFSLLSTNTASTNDDLTSSLVSLQSLPSIESLDSGDFLSMFESSSLDRSNKEEEGATTRALVSELPSTPTTTRLPELHSTPTVRHELPPSTSPYREKQQTKVVKEDYTAQGDVSYRSSISSSNPSTKRSNASSRRTRKSSMSSITDGISSSERSSKESDTENILRQRPRRQAGEKRVSFRNAQLASDDHDSSQSCPRATSGTSLGSPGSGSRGRNPTHQTTESTATSARPCSRGKKLGRAMAEGVPRSLPSVPKAKGDMLKRTPSPTASDRTLASRRFLDASTSDARLIHQRTPARLCYIDRIRAGIMLNLDNVADLASCSAVSRDFYLTFQKYETLLVENVLYRQSPAAWELRHSVRKLEKPSPFKLKSVLRDYSTINALEDFIVWRCASILRPQSRNAFLGHAPERKAELESALWQIWTFCNCFGKTSKSDASLLKQTQWLDGKYKRQGRRPSVTEITRNPCSMKELEDMSEMWRCLETLLSGFKGREEEARQAGLFDHVGETKVKDSELLNLWIHDVTSLGPKAVLTLSSCDFEQAKVLGITRWTPPAKGNSRSNFLKAAVEEVYRERLMEEARRKALDYKKSVQRNHKRSWSDPKYVDAGASSRAPMPYISKHTLNVDTRKASRRSMPPQTFLAGEQLREIRPDCDPLSPTIMSQAPVLSPVSNPGVFSPLAMTQNASTKFGATLFPIQNRDQSQRLSIPPSSHGENCDDTERCSVSDVIDPSDKAMALMVQEMGYAEAEVKRALMLSDTGSGIDVQKAVELLASDKTTILPAKQAIVCELPAATGSARLARKSSSRDICEGHCRPLLVVEPKRERVSGLGMVKRRLSYKMSFRKSTKLSVIPDEEETPLPNSSSTTRSSTLVHRASALSDLASSSISAFSTPALPIITNEQQDRVRGTLENSPVSPIIPSEQDWLMPDMNPISDAQARLEGKNTALAPKPRITLQRVGTGIKKQSWTLPGRKKKEQIIQPEIIGYAY